MQAIAGGDFVVGARTFVVQTYDASSNGAPSSSHRLFVDTVQADRQDDPSQNQNFANDFDPWSESQVIAIGADDDGAAGRHHLRGLLRGVFIMCRGINTAERAQHFDGFCHAR